MSARPLSAPLQGETGLRARCGRRPRRRQRLEIGPGYILLQIERVREVPGSRIARSERPKAIARFDQLQDRGRVIDRVIDEAFLGEGRNQDRRDARSGAPTIDDGRRDVIPKAAILVIGYNDQAVLPERALLDE